MQALTLDIETCAMKLDSSEVFPDELLLEIYAIYKESSDLKFKLWTYTFETLLENALNEFLKEYHSDRWSLMGVKKQVLVTNPNYQKVIMPPFNCKNK
eukprot:4620373-Ditylum_brightwellii.AAC.1